MKLHQAIDEFLQFIEIEKNCSAHTPPPSSSSGCVATIKEISGSAACSSGA